MGKERVPRQHPRTLTPNVVARLTPAGGATIDRVAVHNMSLGGVFLELDDPPRFGADLELEFTLPNGEGKIACAGTVVWNTRDGKRGEDKPAGAGIRLTRISVAEMRKLEKFIASRLGE